MSPSEDAPTTSDRLNFTGDEIVKLHTVTLLSLCAAMNAAGVIRSADMATILSAHVKETDQDAWAHVVRAIAAVLCRDPGPAATHDKRDPPDLGVFSVIQGGIQ